MIREYKYFDITLVIMDLKIGIYYETYLYVRTKLDKHVRYISMRYATESESIQTSLFEVLSVLQDLNPYVINIISRCNLDYEIDKIKEFETLTGIHVTYDVITRFEKE